MESTTDEDTDDLGLELFQRTFSKRYTHSLFSEQLSEMSKELQVLLSIYLGKYWRTQSLSLKQRKMLELITAMDLRNWFYRYEMVQTFGENYWELLPIDSAQILISLEKRILDGYSQVAHAATESLLKIHQTLDFQSWVSLITKNNWKRELYHLIDQGLIAYCQHSKISRGLLVGTLYNMMEPKQVYNICLFIQILYKYFPLISSDNEKKFIVDILKSLLEREINAEKITFVTSTSIEGLAQCCKADSDPVTKNTLLNYLLSWLVSKDSLVRCAVVKALGTCFESMNGRRNELYDLLIIYATEETHLEECSASILALGACFPFASAEQQAQIEEVCLRHIQIRLQNVLNTKQVNLTYPHSNIFAAALDVLGKCFTLTPTKKDIIQKICLSQASIPSNYPIIYLSICQVLGKCFQTSMPIDRMLILKSLSKMTDTLDRRHSLALNLLDTCCNSATPKELNYILAIFFHVVKNRKDSHIQITSILYAHGQIYFQPPQLNAYLNCLLFWSENKHKWVRKVLAQGLLGWAGNENHSYSTHMMVSKILIKLTLDSKIAIELPARIAKIKLSRHFNPQITSSNQVIPEPEEKNAPPEYPISEDSNSLLALRDLGIFNASPVNRESCLRASENKI